MTQPDFRYVYHWNRMSAKATPALWGRAAR